MGKHSSGTIYVAFRDPGQILKIRDCPGDSGTVGAYEVPTILLFLTIAFIKAIEALAVKLRAN